MATKSLSRRFGIRHIMKVANDLAINEEFVSDLQVQRQGKGR